MSPPEKLARAIGTFRDYRITILWLCLYNVTLIWEEKRSRVRFLSFWMVYVRTLYYAILYDKLNKSNPTSFLGLNTCRSRLDWMNPALPQSVASCLLAGSWLAGWLAGGCLSWAGWVTWVRVSALRWGLNYRGGSSTHPQQTHLQITWFVSK